MTTETTKSPDRTAKLSRVDDANRVIATIAAHGRRFFYSPEKQRTSWFELDERGRIWFFDKYSGRRIFTAYKGRWQTFTEGGTLRRLVEDLHNYIRTGQPIRAQHLGPWPGWVCDGDLWGYGEEAMAAVRAGVFGSPAVTIRDQAAHPNNAAA